MKTNDLLLDVTKERKKEIEFFRQNVALCKKLGIHTVNNHKCLFLTVNSLIIL